MPTDSSICSLALIELGQSAISSLDDDSEHARTMKALYPIGLAKVLCEYEWSFALVQKSLGRISVTPNEGYDYVFQLPTDFLKMDEVYGDPDYLVVGKSQVHCNEAILIIRYIRRVEIPTELTDDFSDALSAWLKWKSAKKVANASAADRQVFENDYKVALQKAKTSDAKRKGQRYAPRPLALMNARRGVTYER